MRRTLTAALFLGFILNQVASAKMREEMPNEVIVAMQGSPGRASARFLAKADWPSAFSPRAVPKKPLLTLQTESGPISLYHIRLKGRAKLSSLIKQLGETNGVAWASPNYRIKGDPREAVPNDPKFSEQQHHPVMSNPDAWSFAQGENIVVAVTDDGVDWKHEDLASRIWTNPGEIPDNGIDDDGNGYIDDIRGWDFIGEDNDPGPDEYDDHGTHVAGIVAAESDNGVGLAGTAGRALVMPLRFYGWGADWTSAIVAKTYAYAADNGANIITTSYQIDDFAGDQTFETALRYVHNKGVLQFNSAGNAGADTPKRTKFRELLLVGSTVSTAGSVDVKSSFSNYGRGVDIFVPGEDILSTLPSNKYGSMSGTSMASPNAAGVAALIWSRHPEWTRDQVAAQLRATADSIDSVNATYVGKLGAGRANSHLGVTGKLRPPTIQKAVIGRARDGLAGKITLQFDSTFDKKSLLDLKNWDLKLQGREDVSVQIQPSSEYFIGANDLTFQTTAVMPAGTYRLRATSAITDPFGNRLDGNGDGIPGDDYTVVLTVAP